MSLLERNCGMCRIGFVPTHGSQKFCSSCGVCSVEGCGRDRKNGVYCSMHDRRLRKTGDLNFDRQAMYARGFPDRKARRPHVSLICAQCEKDFSIASSMAFRDGVLIRKFCSDACARVAQDKKPTFVCAQCGELTARTKNAQSQGYNYHQKFCSAGCANDAQRVGFIDKAGYRIFTFDGVQVPEHRRVVEKRLGRELEPHETVHHINGIRLDNRDENLELWSKRHGSGQRVSDKIEFAKSILTEYGISHQVMSSSEVMTGLLGFGS